MDDWLGDLVESSGADMEPVDLIEFTRPGADPHWWQDPRRAILAVEAIRASLTAADPAGRAGYARRARAYTAKLRRLDREIARCMARIPAGQRKLVTAHDSLGYLAARYDIEVIGSVIPSLSTQAQPSAKEVDELVGQIEDEGVNAVFPEAAVSEDLKQAIAREAGAQVGGELWDRQLGRERLGRRDVPRRDARERADARAGYVARARAASANAGSGGGGSLGLPGLGVNAFEVLLALDADCAACAALERARKPPGGLAEQGHDRRDEQAAHDRGVDRDRDREPDSELLDDRVAAEDEAREHARP